VRTTVAALAALVTILTSPSLIGQEQAAMSPRNANYDIDVRLDHSARTLAGGATIRWRNISNRPTAELQFHLYWNAWRNNDSTWLRERKLTGARDLRPESFGSIDIAALRVRASDGAWVDVKSRVQFIAPDDGNKDDRTVLRVPLDRPVPPGGAAEVNVEWTAKVPQAVARTGYVGNYYFIAQWFPKLGVLEDDGWNTHQFHAATEFFADYGVYDVAISVPSAFVVGATGCSTDPAPPATPACATSPGKANGDGTTTHRFHAEDVHDFAWTASPDTVDLTRTFQHPTLPSVQVRLLLRPERRSQEERYFAIVDATLRLYGEWFGAYPYGYATVVDPAFQSQSDGMEYPTLFTGRGRWLAPATVQVPEMTTGHEAGHQWWYGMVGSNEFEHAWMDEGLNTFSTARVLDETFAPNYVEARFFGGFVPWPISGVTFGRYDNDRLTGYRDNAEADVQSTPTWRYWPSTATFISYNKTALWLHTLENHLGWPTLQKILATYFERWKFRHPRPGDFFAVVNEVSGRDLTWFFDQAYRSSNTFDYAVQDLRSDSLPGSRYRTTVVVRRHGEATFPVDVVTRFAGGAEVKERWDGLDRRVVYQYERPERVVSAAVDPARVLLLDANYTNNSRALASQSGAASLKWALTWMVWLQQLMLSYGFFV
jgi:aminopeptidase N